MAREKPQRPSQAVPVEQVPEPHIACFVAGCTERAKVNLRYSRRNVCLTHYVRAARDDDAKPREPGSDDA